jgi:hypothetical protein
MKAIVHRAGLLLLTLAMLAAPAAASAATYYANPSGTGSTCSQAEPCELQEAIEKATSGSSVVLQPGTYTPSVAVFVTVPIDFGGEAGKAASTVIDLTGALSGLDVFVNSAGAVAHDFTVVGADATGSLQLVQGTVERMVSVRTGSTSEACDLDPQGGTTPVLRDSVCWVQASGAGVSAAAVATGSGVAGSAVLRNDDFVSSGPEGVGLFVAGRNSGSNVGVEAVNVIADGVGLDVVAKNEFGGEAGLSLSHSSFSTAEATGGATVTPTSTAGNLTAAPQFVDAAAGDFREMPGSPTIDAGLDSPLNGDLDLAGQPRTQGGCSPATDIGAYELSVSPVPPCVPMPTRPSNRFRVKRIKKLPKTGTALVTVSVPGAGRFTLSGKGVKRVTRTSAGATVLKLPVAAMGRAKTRLLADGKLQVQLKLRFAPDGGTPLQRDRKLTLVRSAG